MPLCQKSANPIWARNVQLTSLTCLTDSTFMPIQGRPGLTHCLAKGPCSRLLDRSSCCSLGKAVDALHLPSS